MKKISIMFAATLALAAFTGCKKKGGGDCAGTVNTAMDRAMEDGMKEMKDMPPEQKKMAEEMAKNMMPKMKDAMTKACVDDKWSADALKCFNDAKTEVEMKGCESKLSPEQNANMKKAMSAAMGMGDMGGHDMGSGSAMAGSGSATADSGSGSAAAPAAGGGDIPQECQDYKAMMDKLASCDKMPAATKDAMKQGYDAMSKSWANMGSMPAESKAAMAQGCKSGADALKQAGSALCGW